jgi:hypothetical protein
VKGISDGAGWDRLYQMSYFFGFLTAGLLYWAFHTIFPAEKQTGGSPFSLKAHDQRVHIGDERLGVIDGQPVEAFEALPGTGHKQFAKAESTSVDSV